MTISYEEALNHLNQIRRKNGFPPVKRAGWLEDGRVQSHFFGILSFDPDNMIAHWECRDCGLAKYCYLTQPPGTIYPGKVTYVLVTDSYLIPSEKGSVHWKRTKLPDCRSFLVQEILTR